MTTYGPSEESVKLREATEKAAKKYIYETAPKKYHDVLVPKFPLGKALHSQNIVFIVDAQLTVT